MFRVRCSTFDVSVTTNETRSATLAYPFPAAALGDGHHVVHSEQSRSEREAFHWGNCLRVHTERAFHCGERLAAGAAGNTGNLAGGRRIAGGLRPAARSPQLVDVARRHRFRT